MEQSFDARGIPAADGNDVRGNSAVDGIDARRIDTELGAPACPECGKPLRAAGPGRRPVYCGRACSSKAYRRRRSEGQQDAVADALISSRVDIPAAPDAGARELLELAAAVQRAATRYLQRLDEARRGGEDPAAGRALELLETSVTGATQRLLRKAHVLRYEMLSARGRAERAAAAAAASAGRGPGAAPDGTPAVAPSESSRVETTPGGDAVLDPQPGGPTHRETPDAARPVVPQPAPERARVVPVPRADVSSRVETAGPALGLA
ncbi:hypothetical protein PUR61_05185 [Streptomyces sp. BE20]|uniref:hypothetical protein n=1 Tax=Streptomyces sp. BE20 TaxID=3002525 RepID=UPI002E75D531|nr:hypothetical protein [Streptomyces sp. BE20]MEE1821591.1 hypothetical protein [Streptomyces sp. BE20]